MQKISRQLRQRHQSIGFVPTMGALHEGHLSLVDRARRENRIVVVSIFVNPRQFGLREDLARYPRPFRKDLQLCEKKKVDFIFYPTLRQMYPEDFHTHVEVEDLSEVLCGKSRPGHFRGVATVVTKLFNIILPHRAYFGRKDAQQAVVIQRMVKDLNMAVSVKVMPTVREKDGLAMSSRNTHLKPQERKDAVVLSESLSLARKLITGGEKSAATIIDRMRNHIAKKPSAKTDYIAIVNGKTLEPVKKVCAGCLIALAVRIGKTRLIDNYIA